MSAYHELAWRHLFFSCIASTAYAATTGVGGYVALGLGISPTASSTAAPASIAPPTATAASTGGYRNVSVDECYSSWENYWSSSSASFWASYNGPSCSYSATTTVPYTDLITESAESVTTRTYIQTLDYTSYLVDGQFTLSTATIDTTSTSVWTDAAQPATTVTETGESVEYISFCQTISVPTQSVPKPTCKLPRTVSQCQSSWEAWLTTELAPPPTPPAHCDVGAGQLNNRTVPPCAAQYQKAEASYSSYIGNPYQNSPLCNQASIGGALCESVRQNYVNLENGVFLPNQTFWAFSGGYLGNLAPVTDQDFSTIWTWPTSSTLGPVPSCTLGCGRCAVTGGTVQLIYWAPTPTAPANGSLVARLTAHATPSPSPTTPATVVTLGTTLTSPTLYISYGNVYASNGCRGVGTTISSTIVAIPTISELSSIYAGTIPCDAHFRPTQIWTATAPFTLEDLYYTSVPQSIYTSQPWCASYMRNEGCTPSCPTTRPYEPILVVPDALLQAMQPDWADCYGDIRGVYDPPRALTPVNAPAEPTQPPGASTTPLPTSVSAGGDGLPTASATPSADPTGGTGSGALGSESASARTTDNPGGIIISLITQATGPAATVPSESGSGSGSELGFGSGSGSGAGTQSGSGNADPGTIVAGSATFAVSSFGPGGGIVIAGSSLTTTVAAGSVATISGQVVSAGPNGASVIAAADPSVLTVDGQTLGIQTLQNGGAAVTGASFTNTLGEAGATVTIGGQTISAGASGLSIVDPSQQDVGKTVSTGFTAGGATFGVSTAAGGSGYIITGAGYTATVDPGQSVTVSGEVLGAGPSGLSIVDPNQQQGQGITVSTAFTAGGADFGVSTATDGSGYVIAGAGYTTTLDWGHSVTLSGEVLSAGPSGLVVFGPAVADVVSGSLLTIGTDVFDVSASPSGWVITGDGITETVEAGSSVTVDGDVLSAGPSGLRVVSTVVATTTTTGGGGHHSSSTTNAPASTSTKSVAASSSAISWVVVFASAAVLALLLA